MILLEYEAKNILQQSDLPVPQSTELRNISDTATAPCVLKSQVPTGGRGKLGGIKIAKDQGDIAPLLTELFNHPIKEFLPKTILAEELLAIDKEFYISLLIDRDTSSIHLVAHPQGGVEVEDNNPDEFLKVALTPRTFNEAGEQLAELYDLPGQTFALQEIVKNLYECFIKNDATLIEINPLVLTKDDTLVAGDCKMTLDDAAAFRHRDWKFEQQTVEANFVTLDQNGTVATIANGAGLAMATVDAVSNFDMTPANFLDVGGGANAESVLAAFKRIMEYPNVRVIVINIFAGITRCDEIAKAIIQAKEQLSDLPPLCIRLAGTNYEKAAELLAAENITLMPTLEACLEAAKEQM
jgi:succinyl-CoA synthetase beta subunit